MAIACFRVKRVLIFFGYLYEIYSYVFMLKLYRNGYNCVICVADDILIMHIGVATTGEFLSILITSHGEYSSNE